METQTESPLEREARVMMRHIDDFIELGKADAYIRRVILFIAPERYPYYNGYLKKKREEYGSCE